MAANSPVNPLCARCGRGEQIDPPKKERGVNLWGELVVFTVTEEPVWIIGDDGKYYHPNPQVDCV